MNTPNPRPEPESIPPPRPDATPKPGEGGIRQAKPTAPSSEPDDIVNRPVPHRGDKSSIVNRGRTGKVARLSKELRQRINEMLDDGLTYLEIIKNLGDNAKDLNEDIMYRWKRGGYQDYLREQRIL